MNKWNLAKHRVRDDFEIAVVEVKGTGLSLFALRYEVIYISTRGLLKGPTQLRERIRAAAAALKSTKFCDRRQFPRCHQEFHLALADWV
jgi:hypothetical protein